MPFRQVSRGPASYGYITGGTQPFRGSGSGMGKDVGGRGQYAQGQGIMNGVTGAWTPDIGYLFILVLAEMVIFGYLSRRV